MANNNLFGKLVWLTGVINRAGGQGITFHQFGNTRPGNWSLGNTRLPGHN